MNRIPSKGGYFCIHNGIHCHPRTLEYRKESRIGLTIVPNFDYHDTITVRETPITTELQIRGGIEDNSKIIFHISQQKHML